MASFDEHVQKEKKKWKIGSIIAGAVGIGLEVGAHFVEDEELKEVMEGGGLLIGGGAVAASGFSTTLAKQDVKELVASGKVVLDAEYKHYITCCVCNRPILTASQDAHTYPAATKYRILCTSPCNTWLDYTKDEVAPGNLRYNPSIDRWEHA